MCCGATALVRLHILIRCTMNPSMRSLLIAAQQGIIQRWQGPVKQPDRASCVIGHRFTAHRCRRYCRLCQWALRRVCVQARCRLGGGGWRRSCCCLRSGRSSLEGGPSHMGGLPRRTPWRLPHGCSGCITLRLDPSLDICTSHAHSAVAAYHRQPHTQCAPVSQACPLR